MLDTGSSSRIEAELEGHELSTNLLESVVFTNPTWNNIVGRTVIVDIITDNNYKRLGRYNKLISRIPLPGDKIKYELIPYQEVEFKLNLNPKPYSKWILNKFMLLDEDYKVDSSDRFLLGTDPSVDGYLNLVGYLILKTIKQ